MKKINFTEEQIIQIKNLYEIEKYTIDSISKETGYSCPTISKLLRNNGVSTKKGKQVDINQLVEYYNEGLSLTKISTILGIDRHRLSNVLKEQGIDVVNKQNETKFDSTIFDVIDTEEKAYWLGFIYADGYIDSSPLDPNKKSRYVFELSLKVSDVEHLNKFNIFMKHNKNNVKIGKSKCQGKEFFRCRWKINNKHLWNTLNNHGCTPNKSLTLKFPDYSIFKDKSLIRHFIRGYFDGDGCISYHKCDTKGNSYSVTTALLGTHQFIHELENNLPCKGFYPNTGDKYSKETCELRFTVSNSKIFLHYLYDDATIYLNRKYNRAIFFYDDCRSAKELAELLESEIGEGCDANPEISSEIKESEPLQSVETEPILNIETE